MNFDYLSVENTINNSLRFKDMSASRQKRTAGFLQKSILKAVPQTNLDWKHFMFLASSKGDRYDTRSPLSRKDEKTG